MHNKYELTDPIYNIINLDNTQFNWLRPFIDSEHFQRLQHIKQMGMAKVSYPGATHTRFHHSIGTSYIGKRIANKLNFNKTEEQQTMTACLLHDIGHGPFSHLFENLFKDEHGYEILSHEHWTSHFLKLYEQPAFVEKFNNFNKNFPINTDFMTEINNFISHETVSSHNHIIADIVSSQLDADRMDYLLRDSHYCDVSHGKFDLDLLIDSLTYGEDELGHRRLAVKLEGIPLIEKFLYARSLVIKNLSASKKVNAASFLLVSILKEIRANLHEPLFNSLREQPLCRFLEETVNVTYENRDAIIYKSFPYYRMLCDLDIYFIIRYLYMMHDTHSYLSSVRLVKYLFKGHFPRAYRIKSDKSGEIRTMMEEDEKHIPRDSWQIMFHSPKFTIYSHKKNPIRVAENGKIIANLIDESKVIHSISDVTEDICFLFVHLEAYENNRHIQNLIKNLMAKEILW